MAFTEKDLKEFNEMYEKKNYEAMLGVKPHASLQRIEKAFRNKSRFYHPDKNPNQKEAATAAFQKLGEAHRFLLEKKNNEVFDTYHDLLEKLDSTLNLQNSRLFALDSRLFALDSRLFALAKNIRDECEREKENLIAKKLPDNDLKSAIDHLSLLINNTQVFLSAYSYDTQNFKKCLAGLKAIKSELKNLSTPESAKQTSFSTEFINHLMSDFKKSALNLINSISSFMSHAFTQKNEDTQKNEHRPK